MTPGVRGQGMEVFDSDPGDDVFSPPAIVVWDPGYFVLQHGAGEQLRIGK